MTKEAKPQGNVHIADLLNAAGLSVLTEIGAFTLPITKSSYTTAEIFEICSLLDSFISHGMISSYSTMFDEAGDLSSFFIRKFPGSSSNTLKQKMCKYTQSAYIIKKIVTKHGHRRT